MNKVRLVVSGTDVSILRRIANPFAAQDSDFLSCLFSLWVPYLCI